MQGHLESIKEELHQTREDLQHSKEKLVEKEDSFRKKILESDAEIESSKKTIAELQVRMVLFRLVGWRENRSSYLGEAGKMNVYVLKLELVIFVTDFFSANVGNSSIKDCH